MLKIAPSLFTPTVGAVTQEGRGASGGHALRQPDAPIGSTGGKGWSMPRLFGGLPAVAAVALALAVGFGAPTPAHAQEATTTTSSSCSRDAAWTAAMGAELGRAVTGDANGGRVLGAMAGIIHRLTCNQAQNGTNPAALPTELQRLNTNLEDALSRPDAKFESGSDLSDHQKQLLTFLADKVRTNTSVRVVILGHANDPAASAFMNEGVALERAKKAAEFLAEKGIGGARMETVGASQGDGQNRLEIAVIPAKTAPQPTSEVNRNEGGLFGIPGLTIRIGGDRGGHNPSVINRGNGTVNGGPNVNGRGNGNNGGRVAPGPGNSGWNGN